MFIDMKDKIISSLKTEYKGLGLSEKTIDRLADYVKGLVEKEEDIATAVKRDDVKLIATSIQGEIDGIRKAKQAAEDALTEYKKAHPDTTVTPPKTSPEEETEMSKLLKQMEALSARLDQRDIDDRNAAAKKNVEAALKKAGCNNAGILDITLNGFALGDKESEDDAVQRLQAKYNATAKSVFGDGPIPATGGGAPQGDGYKPGAFGGFRKSLEQRGLAPKTEEAKK